MLLGASYRSGRPTGTGCLLRGTLALDPWAFTRLKPDDPFATVPAMSPPVPHRRPARMHRRHLERERRLRRLAVLLAIARRRARDAARVRVRRRREGRAGADPGERCAPARRPGRRSPEIVARFGSLHLQLPVSQSRVTAIGYQGGTAGALALSPLGTQANEGAAEARRARDLRQLDRHAALVPAPRRPGPVDVRARRRRGRRHRCVLACRRHRRRDRRLVLNGRTLRLAHRHPADRRAVARRLGVARSGRPVARRRLTGDRRRGSKLGSVVDFSRAEHQSLSRYTNDSGNHVASRSIPAATLVASARKDSTEHPVRRRRVRRARTTGGRDAAAVAPRGARRRLLHRQRRERGGRPRHHREARRQAARERRRRVTLGNWTWGQQGFAPYLSGTDRVLRPANMSPHTPGRGLAVHDGVAVINLLGIFALDPFESPFLAADRLVEEARRSTPVDHRRLPRRGDEREGRARPLPRRPRHRRARNAHARPDLTMRACSQAAQRRSPTPGMTGPHDSVIGSDEHNAIKRFLTGMPLRLEPATRRRAHRGRARRVRRSRPRYGVRSGARAGRGVTSTAKTATSTRSRASTTHARWKSPAYAK